MSVHDAQPMDIYTDKQGKLWRCVGYCSEPTAIFEEVEGRTPDVPNNFGAAIAMPPIPQRTTIIKARQSGGVTGLMWEGWRRILRPSEQQS